LLPACTPEGGGTSLAEATTSYSSSDYRRTVTLARLAADRTQGLEHERARYLEGLAHYKLSELDAAAKALNEARATSDRWLNAQANVTLASVEVARKQYDAAGYAFDRAAKSLDGGERVRAYSNAARCFDAAGLPRLAENARVSAGEPRVLVAAVATAPSTQEMSGADTVDPTDAIQSEKLSEKPIVATSQPRKAEATEKPATRNGMSARSVRFAIQAGAYEKLATAKRIAKDFEARAAAAKIDAPRVVTSEGKDGKLLYVVQFGSFANRGDADRAKQRFAKEALVVRPYIDGDDQAG
jgi:cell division protein FtsN